MKISFIIPAYNEENYISRCLSSIIREVRNSSCEAEIIVVNNASTDNTKKIVSGFPEVMLVDEPRKGIFYARQAGFQASSGDLIAQIDADSMLTGGWINQVKKNFENNKKIIGLSGRVRFYDLGDIVNMGVNFFYGLAYLSYIINKYIFQTNAVLQGSNSVIKRNALKNIGGYSDSSKFYGEETDLAKRLGKAGEIKFSMSLVVLTSGRRLKREGILKTGWRYIINHLWVIFFKKPFTKSHVDIRS